MTTLKEVKDNLQAFSEQVRGKITETGEGDLKAKAQELLLTNKFEEAQSVLQQLKDRKTVNQFLTELSAPLSTVVEKLSRAEDLKIADLDLGPLELLLPNRPQVQAPAETLLETKKAPITSWKLEDGIFCLADRQYSISPKEHELLTVLLTDPGRPFPVPELRKALNYELPEGQDRLFAVLASLRRKLGENAGNAKIITTGKYGEGYSINLPATETTPDKPENESALQLELDPESQTLRLGREKIPLSAFRFAILQVLERHPNEFTPYERIVEEVRTFYQPSRRDKRQPLNREDVRVAMNEMRWRQLKPGTVWENLLLGNGRIGFKLNFSGERHKVAEPSEKTERKNFTTGAAAKAAGWKDHVFIRNLCKKPAKYWVRGLHFDVRDRRGKSLPPQETRRVDYKIYPDGVEQLKKIKAAIKKERKGKMPKKIYRRTVEKVMAHVMARNEKPEAFQPEILPEVSGVQTGKQRKETQWFHVKKFTDKETAKLSERISENAATLAEFYKAQGINLDPHLVEGIWEKYVDSGGEFHNCEEILDSLNHKLSVISLNIDKAMIRFRDNAAVMEVLQAMLKFNSRDRVEEFIKKLLGPKNLVLVQPNLGAPVEKAHKQPV